MPEWHHIDFENLDLEVVLGEEADLPHCCLAKLLGKWTQGETKQHKIIWRENKSVLFHWHLSVTVSVSLHLESAPGMMLLGGTCTAGVSVWGDHGYLMPDGRYRAAQAFGGNLQQSNLRHKFIWLEWKRCSYCGYCYSCFLSNVAVAWREEIRQKTLLWKEQDAARHELFPSKAIVEQGAVEKLSCLLGLHGYFFTLQLLFVLPLS